jgi:hypothetical protein
MDCCVFSFNILVQSFWNNNPVKNYKAILCGQCCNEEFKKDFD